MRSRVGGDITVTAAKAGVVFLYAPTGVAAATAQDTAREVLAERGTAADTRLERWDPHHQAWVVAAGTTAGLPPGQQDRDRDRSLLAAGMIVAAIIDGTSTSGS